jgi:hypothetical protein
MPVLVPRPAFRHFPLLEAGDNHGRGPMVGPAVKAVITLFLAGMETEWTGHRPSSQALLSGACSGDRAIAPSFGGGVESDTAEGEKTDRKERGCNVKPTGRSG